MEKLTDKLTDLSYEWFGTFMRGLIILIFTILSFCFAFNFDFFLNIENLKKISEFIGIYFWALLGFALIVSYIGGIFMIWLSKKLLKKLNPPPSFNNQNEYLIDIIIDRMSLDIDKGADKKTKWHIFYGLGSRILHTSRTNSYATTYQNKYTMHRSLFLGFGLLGTLNFVFILINICNIKLIPSGVVMPLVMAISFSFLSRFFYKSYQWFWQYLGNEVIWSLYAICARKNYEQSE